MPRSGSTWSFNVCRLLLEGRRLRYAGYEEHLSSIYAEIAEHDAVVKSHGLDELGDALLAHGQCKAIYTRRAPEDAVASCMQMFGMTFESALERVAHSVELWQSWRSFEGVVAVDYATILEAPVQQIERISAHIEVHAAPSRIETIAHRLSLDQTKALSDELAQSPAQLNEHGYHDETLLHPSHIRNGTIGYGSTILNDEQRRKCAALVL